MSDGTRSYWTSRFVFERALAFIYLIAFLCAANQFVPLAGERGLLSLTEFVRDVPFRAAPSLFFYAPTDSALRVAAWLGIVLSCVLLTGLIRRFAIPTGVAWWVLWVLYLSFENVGQTLYAFGWESLLLEAGFFAMFLGSSTSTPSAPLNWIYRWMLFRVMFGAGLIKLRGDACWRDLTCLHYYFETQPIPNMLSWYFHWLPAGVHRAGVLFNHVAELGVPFAYFTPQPVASIAGLITVAFQSTLIVSGNLSWLNWITIVLCISTLDDRWFRWVPITRPTLHEPSTAHRVMTYIVVAVVAILSVGPVINMLSPGQLMNYSFNPIHLVNTYGAFGSITRTRNEIVIEGTDAATITPDSVWREYEFKGKPGDPARQPSQIAPYHLRLDWLMWFAAMSPPSEHPWFPQLMVKLLEGDPATLGLLRTNPFPDRPPHYVRAHYYEYRFTTPQQRRETDRWWNRQLLGEYVAPVALTAGGHLRGER
jgi:Lipase maturation factor